MLGDGNAVDVGVGSAGVRDEQAGNPLRRGPPRQREQQYHFSVAGAAQSSEWGRTRMLEAVLASLKLVQVEEMGVKPVRRGGSPDPVLVGFREEFPDGMLHIG